MGGSIPKAAPVIPAAPPDLSMAIVPAGSVPKGPPVVPVIGSSRGAASADGADVPGMGYAFIEFATIEGASKAKKALGGRRFGANLVEAEYFSEEKYHAKDFARPMPNTDEPKHEPGMELALIGGAAGQLTTLDEAPVMVE